MALRSKALLYLLAGVVLFAALGVGVVHAHEDSGTDCRLCHGAAQSTLQPDDKFGVSARAVPRPQRPEPGTRLALTDTRTPQTRRGPPIELR